MLKNELKTIWVKGFNVLKPNIHPSTWASVDYAVIKPIQKLSVVVSYALIAKEESYDIKFFMVSASVIYSIASADSV